MPRPTLSIVIPTLNERANVCQAVSRAFDLSPAELIVSDGYSSDGTAEAATEAGATVISCPPSRGKQISVGVEQTAGEVVLILHADTWLAPQAADQLRSALSQGAVWGAFRQQIDATGFKYRALEWGNALRAQRLKLPYGDQAIFARRSALDESGGIPDTAVMEDAALSQRLAKLANPVLLPGPVHISARRWQQNGVIRQTLRNWTMLFAWRLGVSEEALAKWYRPNQANDLPSATSNRKLQSAETQ